MLDLERFLRRFRPFVIAPGMAAPATVPVDRTADIMAELARLLASIDEIEDECDRIEAEAEDRSREVAMSANLEAARLASDAQEMASTEHAAACAERRRFHEDAIRARRQIAEREARRIERTARDRIPDVVDEVRRCVLEPPPG
jgi:hypothetical protein